MKFLRTKETIAQNMAFMGIMAAINIILALIIALVPFVSIFLIIFLPLTSALVTLTCKKRYFAIYAFATIGLSLVATLWNMETTVFYVLPSILTGFVFGLLIQLKVHPVWSIFCATIVQSALTFLFVPLINFVFQTDLVTFFLKVFGLQEQPWGSVVVLTFVFLISLIQVFLSYFVVKEEIKKFGFEECKDLKHPWIYSLICGVSSLSIIGLYFCSLSIAYLMLAISFYFAVFLVIRLVQEKYWRTLIVCGVFVLINIFVFALANQYLAQYSQVLLTGITPLCISIISFLVYFLKKQKEQIE